jgi:hypothetical protein
MTEPTTCRFRGEIEVPPGFTAEVTIKLIRQPAEPDEPLPPNPAKALKAAA